MTPETQTISCPKDDCGQKLRIPSNRPRLLVTCPRCRTSWEWAPEIPWTKPARRTSRSSIALWVVAALILFAGVWTHAWLPAGLFVVAFLVRRICRDKLSETEAETLWQKGTGVLYEATAGVCSAVAVGVGFVIALITFLNIYPRLSPANYPAWLLKLENLLIAISAWTQSSNNKLKITIVYLGVIVSCFILSLLARRYQKEWRPVGSLTRFKQTTNKVLLAIQVITFFTFFSHAPIDNHVDELAQQRAWRFGVAKRVEQELEAKRLVAEALTDAARAQKNVAQDEKDAFLQSIAFFRASLPPPPTNGTTRPSSSPSPDGPPNGPQYWPPSNWPRPPDSVLTKIRNGKPLVAVDYDPTPGSPADNARLTDAHQVVTSQIESVAPQEIHKSPADPIRSDASIAKIFPPKTTEQWDAAKAVLAEQELKVEVAKRRYGEAVQVLLESLSEYLSMQVGGDPIVGTWIDLALSDLSDRVYDQLFSKESGRVAKVTAQLRDLFTPREARAARLKERIDYHLSANEYDAAESLISELANYPKTKAGKYAEGLAEEVSFKRVFRSLNSSNEEVVRNASNYLSHHPQAKRAVEVRRWQTSAQAEIARIALEAQKPRMLVYVRQKCSMSQYFRRETVMDGEVIAEKRRFRYQEFDIDQTSPPVTFNTPVNLPIIVFQDRNGLVLDTLTGSAALSPETLTNHMRVVATGRQIASGPFTEPSSGGSSSCPIPMLRPRLH